MSEQASRLGRSITRVFLLSLPLLCVGCVGWQYYLGHREHSAYQQLLALGAEGDDWVGLREFLNPKFRPIVQIKLPPELSVTDAIPSLRELEHLEDLTVRSEQLSPEDFEGLQELNQLSSLNLNGAKLNDSHIPHLEKLHYLTHLSLFDTSITDQGFHRLQKTFPRCRMWRGAVEVN